MRKIKQNAFLPPVALLLATILLAGCGDTDNGEDEGRSPQPPLVRAIEVTPGPILIERTWLGEMLSLRELTLAAPESGVVASVEAREGTSVKRGDPLVVIDGPDFGDRLKVLRERRDFLKRDTERWRRLVQAEAAGAAELEGAELRLLEIEESISNLEERQRTNQLIAPFHGFVSTVNVTPGTRVSQGQAMVMLSDADSWGIRLNVALPEIRYFEDWKDMVVLNGSGTELSVDRMSFSEPSDQARGFRRVKLWLSADAPRKEGTAEIRYTQERESLSVPWTALATDGDENWVAVITPEDKTIERRTVALGIGQSRGIEVTEGLEAGERILRFEPRAYPEGAQVRLQTSRNPNPID